MLINIYIFLREQSRKWQSTSAWRRASAWWTRGGGTVVSSVASRSVSVSACREKVFIVIRLIVLYYYNIIIIITLFIYLNCLLHSKLIVHIWTTSIPCNQLPPQTLNYQTQPPLPTVVRMNTLKGRRGRLPSRGSPSATLSKNISSELVKIHMEKENNQNNIDLNNTKKDTTISKSQNSSKRMDNNNNGNKVERNNSISSKSAFIHEFYEKILASLESFKHWSTRIPNFNALHPHDRKLLLETAFLELFAFQVVRRFVVIFICVWISFWSFVFQLITFRSFVYQFITFRLFVFQLVTFRPF